jgi:hypothetical protein
MGKRVAGAVVAVLAAVTALVGCVPTGPTPVPTQAQSAASSPTPTVPPAPVFDPDATGAQNRAFFDAQNQAYFDAHGFTDGRSYIDNMVAVGFDKTAMEVTPDETSVGLRADAIFFSVRFDDQCLVGQVSGTGYHSLLADTLATGTCLVGQTRAIDW